MYDIAIIGAGPAGASAALFAAKAGKSTILFDHDKSITKRAWVENHYGVMEISGPELVEVGKKQATKFGAELKNEEVTEISAADGQFTINTEQGSYTAKHVLLATGLSADLAEGLGIPVLPGVEPRIPKRIEVDQEGRTSIAGIWAAGTIAGVSVHTIVTAGDGAKVAINIISELNGERYVDHDLLK